jgi:hypothetical protein
LKFALRASCVHSSQSTRPPPSPLQYHYGRRNDIQRAQTQSILDGVIKELMWNPDRRFIYVEQVR